MAHQDRGSSSWPSTPAPFHPMAASALTTSRGNPTQPAPAGRPWDGHRGHYDRQDNRKSPLDDRSRRDLQFDDSRLPRDQYQRRHEHRRDEPQRDGQQRDRQHRDDHRNDNPRRDDGRHADRDDSRSKSSHSWSGRATTHSANDTTTQVTTQESAPHGAVALPLASTDSVSKPANLTGRAPKFNKVTNPFADAQTTAQFTTGLMDDPHRLEQRGKQIQFGKNTVGYDNYLAAVPREKRGHPAKHPRTPNMYEDCSKRCFEGQIREWRRRLHMWDDPEARPDLVPRSALGKKRTAEDAAGDAQKAQEPSTENSSQTTKRYRSDGSAPLNEKLAEKQTELAELAEQGQEEYHEETFSDEDVL